MTLEFPVLRMNATLYFALISLISLQAVTEAQAPAPPPIPTLRERVEVVATRVPEATHEVPVAIEVISGDELRNRGVTNLGSALALATGVDVSPGGDGGPASAVPEFWGLREFDAFLLIVDDVPWGGGFNPALTTLDLHDIERIEILRGPAPVMFGATSFVGVIHVVHRNGPAAPQVLTASVGSFGSGRGSATLSVPLGEWQSRVTFDAERQGFSDDRTSFRRGHVLWLGSRGSAAGRVWFGLDGARIDQSPASPHPRVGSTLTTMVPLDANHNPSGAFLNDRRVSAWFGIERVRGERAWTTTASVSQASHDILRGFLQDVSAADQNAHGFRQQIDLTDLYADTHLAWTGRGTRIILGADLLHGHGDAEGAGFTYRAPLDGSVAPVAAVPSVPSVILDNRRDFAGGYVSAEWSPLSRLRIDTGVRLNVTMEALEHESAAAVAESNPGTQNHVRPSGSVGAAWTAWARDGDHVRLFSNYRNTFKPAAVDFGIGDPGEGPLKPETSRSYEGGVKARVAQGRLDLEATTFLMDFANLVIARTIDGLPALTNAGTERFKGFELGTAWYLSRNVTGRASYSVHDARFRDYVMEFDGIPTQLGGKRLEMSARQLMAAGVVYAPQRGVVALGELNLVGSRFLNKRNTASADPYVTLAAGVGYRTAAWELRVDGRNLTNQRPPVAESELGDAQYYRLPARRLDVTFSIKVTR